MIAVIFVVIAALIVVGVILGKIKWPEAVRYLLVLLVIALVAWWLVPIALHRAA